MKNIISRTFMSLGEKALAFVPSSAQKAKSPTRTEIPCSLIEQTHSLLMNETVDRVPMSDLIFTDKPQKQGFFARSVVGGYWMRLLETKYAK